MLGSKNIGNHSSKASVSRRISLSKSSADCGARREQFEHIRLDWAENLCTAQVRLSRLGLLEGSLGGRLTGFILRRWPWNGSWKYSSATLNSDHTAAPSRWQKQVSSCGVLFKSRWPFDKSRILAHLSALRYLLWNYYLSKRKEKEQKRRGTQEDKAIIKSKGGK